MWECTSRIPFPLLRTDSTDSRVAAFAIARNSRFSVGKRESTNKRRRRVPLWSRHRLRANFLTGLDCTVQILQPKESEEIWLTGLRNPSMMLRLQLLEDGFQFRELQGFQDLGGSRREIENQFERRDAPE